MIMKKSLLHIATSFFAIIMVLSGCDENKDIPTYKELTTNGKEVIISMDDEKTEQEILIEEGNGNYRCQMEDPSIATAEITGNVIKIKGLDRGTTNLLVTDWAKRTQTIKITVTKKWELVLSDTEDIEVYKGNAAKIQIESGNGDYQVNILDVDVASGTINENNEIEITGLQKGETTFTVTDGAGKTTDPIKVTIKNHLIVDRKIVGTYTDEENEVIGLLEIGEERSAIIKILDGNGGYSIQYSDETDRNSFNAVIINENEIKVTGLDGARGKSKKNFKVVDQDGEEVNLTIPIIDIPFKDNEELRFFIAGKVMWTASTIHGNIDWYKSGDIAYRKFVIGGWGNVIFQGNKFKNAYEIYFPGIEQDCRDGIDRVGSKGNGYFRYLNDNGGNGGDTNFTKARVLKVGDPNTGNQGWKWIAFREVGNDYDSYAVIQKTK